MQPTEDSGSWRPAGVLGSEDGQDSFGERHTELSLDRTVAFAAGLAISGVRLQRPTRSVGLWLQTDDPTVAGATLSLDGLHRDLRVGELILVERGGYSPADLRWFRVNGVAEQSASVVVANDGTNDILANLPYTELTLDADLDASDRGSNEPWDSSDRASLTVWYGLREAGQLAAPAQAILAPSAAISLVSAPVPFSDTGTTRFVLQDVDGVSAAGNGQVDFAALALLPTSFDVERPPLTLPVSLFGNVVAATRGQSVSGEVLGSGDAALQNQSFELQKAPLTYLNDPSSTSGFASSLRVWVDGRLWREVDSFFFAGPEDLVYTVALDEDGKARVTFGDGVHGAPLPSGQDNVVASYRFGAGAAAPPAASITQLARGAAGLASVKQPQAASGGADAETQQAVRSTAPRKTLTLGRAVSIRDMEAFAADTNAVRAVSVEWTWDKKAQRPVVQVWVVGDAVAVAPAVLARLQAVSDPTTPIAVSEAEPVPVTLALAIEVDQDYVGSDVRDAVAAALLARGTGPLSVEQLGIGRPLYFSRLTAAVHGVAGVQSLSFSWTREGGPSATYADSPGTGRYFALSAGITIDGTEYADG
jgi:hypothetical protein